jgi:DNA-binding SARP family transcriptional activator
MARRVVAARLFASRLEAPGEWYRYHHLLSAHLQQRLASSDPARLREQHRRAAAAWLAAGEPLEAARHALTAGDEEAAARALATVAERLATSPEAEALAALLGRLPDQVRADHPPLLLAAASIALGRADHAEVIDALSGAVERLIELGDHERAATACFRMMQGMVAAGTRPDRRAALGRRYLSRLDPAARMVPAVRIMQAASAAYSRRFGEADAELRAALASPAASPAIAGYAAVVRAHYLTFARDGRPEALDDITRAIATLPHTPDRDEIAFLPWARMLRCYEMVDLGLYEDALEEAAGIEEDAGRWGMARTPGRALAWLRATALLGLRGLDDAAGALGLHDRGPGSSAETTAYSYRHRSVAALLAADSGDPAGAVAHIRGGLEAMRAFGPASDDPMFLADFALAAWRAGEADLAGELARDAGSAAAGIGAAWQRARSAMVIASVEGEGPAGDASLVEALTASADRVFEGLWTRRERRLAAPLLSRALRGGLGPPGVAARLIARCGGDVLIEVSSLLRDAPAGVRAELASAFGETSNPDAEALDELLRDPNAGVRSAARTAWVQLRARPRAAVRIQTFGGLAVWRDGVRVADSAFGRAKARALLGVLIARRNPVHREELCELLWPELAPERAAAALRTTLHDLRRALHPELDASSPAALIAGDGDVLTLTPSERDRIDAVELEAHALSLGAEGEELAGLEAAEGLYRGPFLPEFLYDDWAVVPRQHLAEAHETLLVRLAEALHRAGRWEAAALRWRRLLATDPEREQWHRCLMRAYAATGERALALRQYHACRTALLRGQGVEPGPETQAYYLELLRQDQEADRAVTQP